MNADAYVMVDGDGTYPVGAVHELVAPILRGEADMVVGSRLHAASASHFRRLNRIGNRLFLGLLNLIFGVHLTDMLSGYRALSRRLVRSLPLLGGGFEIESELTVKALQRRFSVVEVPVDLRHRPEGSRSKIRIVRDGFLILSTIVSLSRDYKPLTFFGGLGLVLSAAGLVTGWVAISDYVPGKALSHPLLFAGGVALVLLGVVVGLVGLILHTVARRFQELDASLQALGDDIRARSAHGTRQ